MATEYIKLPKFERTKIEALKFRKYIKHPSHFTEAPGTYTDDTEMSIGNTEVLLEQGHFPTRLDFGDKWVEVFQRTRRKGYSSGFQMLLENAKSGQELIDALEPNSDKNGAAMRSVPLGVLPTPRLVMRVAEMQAKITHDTPGGILSSQAVALMSHYVLHTSGELSRKELKYFLVSYLPEFLEYTKPWEDRVVGPNVGLKTAQAAFNLITSCDSLLEILKATIELGGDTDSVGAISCGIASAKLKNDLPEFMEHCLEPGSKYRAGFLKRLGSQLMSKFG